MTHTPEPIPDLIITDEMVEISADAQWRYEWPRREFRCEPDDLRDFYRNSTRAALEAVAPLIAAKAWEEGYTEGSRGRMWDSINPYQTRAHVSKSNIVPVQVTSHLKHSKIQDVLITPSVNT